MIKTLGLLEEKNNYLEKFVALNKLKLQKLNSADFSELQEFRENRENILNIIKHIDSMIEVRTQSIEPTVISVEVKQKIQKLLEEKDELVHTILAQDLEIMQIIDAAKSQIIVELQNVRRNKKTIASYKSFNKPDILDEEA